jgi:hypothetical protein
MKKLSTEELQVLEEILDFIRPVVDLDYVYCEDPNVVLIGDNYIVKVFEQNINSVPVTKYALIYGSNHTGYSMWSLSRWAEEDIAVSTSFESLLPIFCANIMQRIVENKVYDKLNLATKQRLK